MSRGADRVDDSVVDTPTTPSLPPLPPPVGGHRNPASTLPSVTAAVATPAAPPAPRQSNQRSLAPSLDSNQYRSPLASDNSPKQLGPGGILRDTTHGMDRSNRTVLYLIMGAVVVALMVAVAMFANALGGTTLVGNMKTGDCLEEFFQSDANGYSEVFFVQKTSCDNPHAMEVYADSESLFIGQSDFPGEDGAFAVGDAYCLNQFEAFTGLRYEESPYEMWTFVPLAESWSQGDRKVQCLIGSYDEFTLITGTLRDSGR